MRLKELREAQALSQRDLASISGVAQATIGQIERGERKARPSTIRKLAKALRVESSAFFEKQVSSDQQRMDTTEAIAARGLASWGRVVPKGSDGGVLFPGEDELPRAKQERIVEQRRKTTKRVQERREEQRSWEAAGKWAEYYVAGKLKGTDYFIADRALTNEEEEQARVVAEENYFRNGLPDPQIACGEDIIVARSKVDSDDPKETVEAAQLTLQKAWQVMKALNKKLDSFAAVPERYYEDPASARRAEKLCRTLQQYRREVITATQELLEIRVDALARLEEEIDDMRKEGDKLEALMRGTSTDIR